MANMLIGNYVHYKWANYQKYGIGYGPSDPQEVGKAMSAFNQQRLAILKKVRMSSFKKAGVKVQLENQLNFFFNPTAQQAVQWGYSAEQTQQLQAIIREILSKSTDAAIDKVRVDYDNLSAKAYENTLSSTLQSQINKYGKLSAQKTPLAAVEKRMTSLMQLYNLLGTEALANPNPNLNILKSRIAALEKQYQQLCVDLQGKKSVTNQQKFIDTLNQLIIDLKITSASHAQGALAETLPIAIEYIMSHNINQNLSSLLADFEQFKQGRIIGDSRAEKVVDPSKFIGKNINYDWLVRFGDVDYNIRATQDKIDIQLTMPNGITYPASVKNYSHKTNDFHILSGVSILKYTQDYPSFMNHYLNITSLHAEGGPREDLIMQAHETLKLTILLGAIAGGLLTSSGNYSQQAELFIVNTHKNGSKGGYKVYFIDDIIDNAAATPRLIRLNKYPTLWRNEWVGGPDKDAKQAYRRIANILAQLHSFQLQMSISKNALI